MTSFVIWKRLQSFLSFSRQWFYRNWQSLLLTGFGLYLPLLIFILLTVQIWQYEGGLSWDISILMAIHATAQQRLDKIATLLTQLGTEWGVFPATIIVAFGLLYFRRWRSLIYWLLTLVGGGALNIIAKALLHRVRPSLWEYPALADFSFPSGHATSSMLFVLALVVLTWQSRWCWWILPIGIAFVGAIGWTRLYLGVHYPSDILAGWMMAIAWAISVRAVVKPQGSGRIKGLQNTP
ncbi:MAG: phosphatase PAP2 family protein [Elainellaceae cyanobacterium]